MKIIDEIWYNGFTPNHLGRESSAQCRELCTLIERNEQELLPLLSDKAKEVFEKMKDNRSELDQICECEIFAQGFRLGARIMIDVLDDGDGEDMGE